MLILRSEDIHNCLPFAQAIELMKQAMAALSSGAVNIPERIHLESQQGTTLVMPGSVDSSSLRALVVKVVSVFNQNDQCGLPNILGALNVLDPETGRLLAIMDGATVTAIRTAATSSAATDLLANPDASRLAIIGSGVQARTHFHAIRCIRKLESCSIFSPRPERVRELVEELKRECDSSIQFVAAPSSKEATADADIVCTVTNASTPVIEDSAISDGCHINAIGAYKPEVSEVPKETVARSRVYVDEMENALHEAGDLVQAIQKNLITREHIVGEIGQLVLEQIEGRTNPKQVTLFKSVGNTVQDTFAAQIVLENAINQQLGQQVEF